MYDQLQRINVGSTAKKKMLHSGKTPISSELNQRLSVSWGRRLEGRPVTNGSPKAKATQISSGLRLKASSWWLWQWKKWYRLRLRCGINSAQKIPANYADQLHHFRKSVIALQKAKNIDPSRIINNYAIIMHQTMCRFDMPSKHTNTNKGGKIAQSILPHA